MILIWFIVWMVHGHPWLLSEWTPWNISLLACAFFDNIAASHVRGGSRPRKQETA